MNNKSSKSLLKSTGIIGISQILVIFFNIIRSKFIAIFLGPSGTGFFSTLQTILNLIINLASLGIHDSAIRDVAQSYHEGNQNRIATVIRTLRILIIFTASLGTILTVLFADYFSMLTFNSTQYSWNIKIISIAIFFNILHLGESSLIQGRRQLKDLAKYTILAAFFSTIISIPLFYLFKLKGITIFFIIQSILLYLFVLNYSHKIKYKQIQLNLKQILNNSKQMIKLGLAFMGVNFSTVVTAYIIRIFIIRELNLNAVGLYQSAFAIGGVYMNIILKAMAKDFYPQLSAYAFQTDKEHELIKQQISVGVILAAPGLFFTLALAPMLIKVLYSGDYLEAFPILQWIIFGIFLRIISWPMAYMLIARGLSLKYFIIEFLFNLLHIILVIVMINLLGLEGTGVAFFILYFFYTIFFYLYMKKENNFIISSPIFNYILIYFSLILISIYILNNIEYKFSLIIILIFVFISLYITFKKISSIFEINDLQSLFKLFLYKYK